MAPVTVAQDQVDIRQRQRGCLALLVRPAQFTAFDEHLSLGKKPICRPVVARRVLRHRQAGHIHGAVGRAPHIQLGPFDIKLFEPAIEQGAGRQRDDHPGQAQRGPACGIQQRHVQQFKRRDQPFGARGDGADLHRNPQRPCGMRLQLRAKIADSRHNPAMKSAPCDGQQQPEGQ